MPQRNLVLALDQGTTSTRSIVFDAEGRKLAHAQVALEQHFPRPGLVEHDADVIWRDQLATARNAIASAGASAGDIAAIGVTNQRETVVVWDRATGRPIHNAIVWQDRRTAETCEALIAAGHGPRVREVAGLAIDPYFSATKIGWVLDAVPGARARAEAGELAVGTIDSWLTYKLTGGAVHVTDVTNASRYLLLDISTAEWSEELCELFGVPSAMLPTVVRSSGVVGHSAPELLGARVPIAALCGDQQAALAGNGGFAAGSAKATFGTGVFALMHTGAVRPRTETLSVTLAATLGDELHYALEGSVFMGGAVVQWLVEQLHLAADPAALAELAESVPDSAGVVFVPALTGLGAPEWDPYARGAMFGLTRGASAAHIARAGIEAIPLQVGDLVGAMVADSGHALDVLRVDGGVTVNALAMATLADVLGVPVHRAQVAESTALGVAFLAGRAVGVWDEPADLPALLGVDRVFEPQHHHAGQIAALKARWSEGVRRSLRWERG